MILITQAFAQVKAKTEDGKNVILNNDGTWVKDTTTNEEPKMTLPNAETGSFYWKDGYDKIVEVEFKYIIDSIINKEILDKIVMAVMVKSKHALKNRLSFIPKELTLMQKDDGGYYAISKFYGKNSYGAEGVETAYFTFDLDGNVNSLR